MEIWILEAASTALDRIGADRHPFPDKPFVSQRWRFLCTQLMTGRPWLIIDGGSFSRTSPNLSQTTKVKPREDQSSDNQNIALDWMGPNQYGFLTAKRKKITLILIFIIFFGLPTVVACNWRISLLSRESSSIFFKVVISPLSEVIGFLPTCWLTNCLNWRKNHCMWVSIYTILWIDGLSHKQCFANVFDTNLCTDTSVYWRFDYWKQNFGWTM